MVYPSLCLSCQLWTNRLRLRTWVAVFWSTGAEGRPGRWMWYTVRKLADGALLKINQLSYGGGGCGCEKASWTEWGKYPLSSSTRTRKNCQEQTSGSQVIAGLDCCPPASPQVPWMHPPPTRGFWRVSSAVRNARLEEHRESDPLPWERRFLSRYFHRSHSSPQSSSMSKIYASRSVQRLFWKKGAGNHYTLRTCGTISHHTARIWEPILSSLPSTKKFIYTGKHMIL